MFKFTSLIFFAVAAVILSYVYAGDPEELMSLLEECAKLHGHSMMELDAVMMKGDVSKIKPCFWGCAFTKTGFLNDKGQYDLDAGLISIKKYMKDPEAAEKLEQVARQCESVKDKDVSDGEAGCERGMLTAKCFIENIHV